MNGTTVRGLAGRTAELLRGFGYDVIATGNADHSDYDRTIVIDRSGLEDLVTAFAGVIRCTNIRYETPIYDEAEMEINIQNYNYEADLTLILGKDFNGRYVTE
jgi:hypothetical protein